MKLTALRWILAGAILAAHMPFPAARAVAGVPAVTAARVPATAAARSCCAPKACCRSREGCSSGAGCAAEIARGPSGGGAYRCLHSGACGAAAPSVTPAGRDPGVTPDAFALVRNLPRADARSCIPSAIPIRSTQPPVPPPRA